MTSERVISPAFTIIIFVAIILIIIGFLVYHFGIGVKGGFFTSILTAVGKLIGKTTLPSP